MSDTKKLLVIGASILQLPAILEAKSMGFHVGVLDYDPNAIGIPYADEFFEISTIDINGVASCATQFRPDGIVTLATDMPMRSVAKAVEACELTGIDMETAVKATDKWEMIKAFDENSVEHPWFLYVHSHECLKSLEDRLSYPCIIKPTDNAGSRGVVLVNNSSELNKGYLYAQRHSREGHVIIEEFLTGQEVSVEIIAFDGIPHVIQITDKITTGAPHFVEMGHTQPSRLPEREQALIKDLACRAVEAIGIKNGPAHVEIMLTDKGPKMIELGARLGGDNITTYLVPLSTGINMVKATIQIACGITPNISAIIDKGSAIRYFPSKSGTITSIEGVEKAKSIAGVKEIVFTKKVGETISSIGSSTDRIGYVIAQGDNAEEALEICNKAMDSMSVTIQ